MISVLIDEANISAAASFGNTKTAPYEVLVATKSGHTHPSLAGVHYREVPFHELYIYASHEYIIVWNSSLPCTVRLDGFCSSDIAFLKTGDDISAVLPRSLYRSSKYINNIVYLNDTVDAKKTKYTLMNNVWVEDDYLIPQMPEIFEKLYKPSHAHCKCVGFYGVTEKYVQIAAKYLLKGYCVCFYDPTASTSIKEGPIIHDIDDFERLSNIVFCNDINVATKLNSPAVCITSTVNIGTFKKLQNASKYIYMPNEYILGGSTDAELVVTEPCIKTDLETAEVLQHIYCSYIQKKLEFVQETALLCEQTAVNVKFEDVTTALALFDINTVSHLTPNIRAGPIHDYIVKLVHTYLCRYQYPVIVLGMTCEQNSRDITQSPAIQLARSLRTSGIDFEQFDPYVSKEPLRMRRSIVVIATNHTIFAEISLPRGSVIIDPFDYIPYDTKYAVMHKIGNPAASFNTM